MVGQRDYLINTKYLIMDIQDILQKGTSVMLVVSAQDLENFAKSILAKAEENHRANTQDVKGGGQKEDEEKYLSAKKVQELFGICSSTLWSLQSEH